MKVSPVIYLMVLLLLASCREPAPLAYVVSGRVTDYFGVGIAGVEVVCDASTVVLTDRQGYWAVSAVTGQKTFTATAVGYTFAPQAIPVASATEGLLFRATPVPGEKERQIIRWFNSQQLANGLLESAENGNVVSLYDNALAALVFMLTGDVASAEKIFDFFNARISTELTNGMGGFSQLRDRNGVPNGHRWMGDNAWLIIALNHYKALTGASTYDNLSSRLSLWLIDLQHTDGGLLAGYNGSNSLMNYKVTEGNIDAFNAIGGYTAFHQQLLGFLGKHRWDAAEKSLVAWPENPPYLYALDLHPWSYLIFPDFPVFTLTSAQRFLTTQSATNGGSITGYCFDEDKDNVWLEGTGQMAVAFGMAGMNQEKALYLAEMENILIQSTKDAQATGFPYASNPGTAYATDALWAGADTKIALSGGAWYLFAALKFNPFAVGRNKNISISNIFWIK